MTRVALAFALLVAGPALVAAAAPTVTIGLPPPGARGVYEDTYVDLGTDDSETVERPFAGEAGVRTFDASGRRLVADSWSVVGGSGTAGGWTSLAPGLPSLENRIDVDILFQAWFEPGVDRPFAYTASTGVRAAGGGMLDSEAGRFTLVEYGDRPALCDLRNPLQGRTVSHGETIPEDSFCPTRAPVEATWQARVEHGRLRLDAPYRATTTVTMDGRTTVTEFVGNQTWWYQDGFPFPVEVRVHAPCVAECDGDAGYALSRKLTRYDPGPHAARAPATASADRTPLPVAAVSRWGPADGAGLAWPLSEAVATVVSHPLLPGVRDFLASHDDAVLAYAEYHAADRAADVESWRLVFTDPGGDAWTVTLERAAGTPGFAPVGAHETDVSGRGLPALGVHDLPEAAPALADALAAWTDAYAPSAGVPVSVVWSAGFDDDLVTGPRPFVGAGRLRDRASTLDAPATATAQEHFLALGVDGRRDTLFAGATRAGPLASLPVFEATGPASPPDRAEGVRTASVAVWTGVAVAGAGGLLFLLLLVLEPLRHALGRLVFVPLFSRLERGEVLDNEARRRVLEVAHAEPGVNASELLAKAAVSGGVGGYHLGVLEREGYLTAVETAGFRRYYVTGSMDVAAMRRDAALRAGSSARVHAIVLAEPGIRLTDLARRAGLSIAVTSKTVKALEKAGLVAKERRGREVVLRSA